VFCHGRGIGGIFWKYRSSARGDCDICGHFFIRDNGSVGVFRTQKPKPYTQARFHRGIFCDICRHDRGVDASWRDYHYRFGVGVLHIRGALRIREAFVRKQVQHVFCPCHFVDRYRYQS